MTNDADTRPAPADTNTTPDPTVDNSQSSSPTPLTAPFSYVVIVIDSDFFSSVAANPLTDYLYSSLFVYWCLAF